MNRKNILTLHPCVALFATDVVVVAAAAAGVTVVGAARQSLLSLLDETILGTLKGRREKTFLIQNYIAKRWLFFFADL